MDEARQVKALLTAVADRGVDGLQPPAPAGFARTRRHRRRSALAVVATVCAVLAIVVPVAVYRGAAGRPSAQPAPASWPSTGPYPTTGPGTVAALRVDHWSTLPAAPIAGRSEAVGVWTGSAMLVWGGADEDGRVYADGAAYDPAAKRWSVLPAAPISARADPSYVWTGSQLFVWGGTDGSGRHLQDGAAYSPASQAWAKLPAPPSPDTGPAAAVWTGSAVVLLTSASPHGGVGPTVVHAQRWNPASDSWTSLPDLRLPATHNVLELSAVAVGRRVLVWPMWSHVIDQSRTSSSTRSGVDSYLLAGSTWSAAGLLPVKGRAVTNPIWTGREVLVPTSWVWCGTCSYPGAVNVSGLRFDPRTATRNTLPHGPVSDLGASYLWTGAALLGFDTNTERGGAGETVTDYPGEAAAWDPATGAWSGLPRAPLAGNDAVGVWTGDALLVWGSLYATTEHGTTSRSDVTGLRLGP